MNKPSLPIWFQLAVTTMLVIVLTSLVLNFVVLNRQKGHLYNQSIKIGTVSLRYFGNNAGIPLLSDNTLQLNTLIKNATQTEGIVYAFILDNNGIVKAHTDLDKVGKRFAPHQKISSINSKDGINYFNRILQDGRHVINLSMPIMFKEKKLGSVNVGISTDFIQDLVIQERTALILITLGIILFGIVLAVAMGFRYSRPIKKLVRATEEVQKGNYGYRVDLSRNDELASLAKAFNRMNSELLKNNLMKETFGKYIGSEVLEMIMANPQNTWLKGKRSKATILFADIRGFTYYSDTKEPEIVIEMLNHYFDIATKEILAHGGYVDKFIGDAVLGVFGMPIFRKNHVESAVKAALSILDKLRKAADNGNALLKSVGIGLDTGVVVSGNIGSQVKMEYTVIGNSVNLASHLNDMAGPGEIIITQNIYEEIEDILQVESLSAKTIKGKFEQVNIYKVIGLKADTI